MIKARVPGTKTANVLNLAVDFHKIIIVQWNICPSILFSFSSKKKRDTVGYMVNWASQVALVVKNVTANAEDLRDTGLILRLGRFPVMDAVECPDIPDLGYLVRSGLPGTDGSGWPPGPAPSD